MQGTNNNDSSIPKTPSSIPSISSGSSKEHEGTVIGDGTVKEVSVEVKIPPEIERVGVKKFDETVELPPDVKKLGVTPAGPSIPVSSTTSLTQVTLPISDQKVLSGLGASVTSALLWLAVWCVKKLKKAHVKLKVIGGKIIRVKN